MAAPLVQDGPPVRRPTLPELFLNSAVNSFFLGDLLRTCHASLMLLACGAVAPLFFVASLGLTLARALRNASCIAGSPPENGNHHVVVVTGCDSGFGRDAALRLAELGWTVVAACLEDGGAARLEEDASRLQGSVLHAVQCDVTVQEDLNRLLAAAKGVDGVLHAIVNNAGIGATGNIVDNVSGEWERVFRVNVFAPALVARTFAPALKDSAARGSVQPRIVNVTSAAAFAPCMPGVGIYQASKHAAQAMTQTLAYEMRREGVLVCSINPSFHRTQIFENGMKTMMADAQRHASSDPAFAAKRISASEVSIAIASQSVWDPVHVRDAIIRVVASRTPPAVVPVGLDAALVIQPLSALPFEVHLWNYENVVERFGRRVLRGSAEKHSKAA